jgi:pyruvate-ferredoxin/flavodoxin oxidoreductase
MKNILPARLTIDANEATAHVAYALSELIVIYPITPSSPMAEHCDEWSAAGKPNLWGDVPSVVQMQSEGGAAGTLHGTLMAGSPSTTFTASQGLLLMIPNLYKIAGELTPAVIHVTARALATNGLSIFGDHSDVMACRQTGWAMLASNSVQEAHDMAAIAHAATLRSRIPFMHFFDGFRTSHEVNSVEPIDAAVLEALIEDESLSAFVRRGLSPDRPGVSGTAHNPDTYFQSREATNPFYADAVTAVRTAMEQFAEMTGRTYQPFEYHGPDNAECVLILMGSAVETAQETVDHLNRHYGTRYGVVTPRLYRPFDVQAFLKVLPKTIRRIAVLDRTKEPGGVGEPLYLDVTAALRQRPACVGFETNQRLTLIGGRYGLGSKELTPTMVKAVFDELERPNPRHGFTVGIHDDVTDTSLTLLRLVSIESPETTRAVFFGLGSDGTVGANKNTIKIIGEATDLHAQAYFVYDSKKSGGLTTSHLRFGPEPIRAPYLIDEAQFVACHQPTFIGRVPMLEIAAKGGTFLLNTPHSADTVWNHLPRDVQQMILQKQLRFFVIDANKLAGEMGLGRRINMILQTAFFSLSGILPEDEAISQIKKNIAKTYGRKGQKIVDLNCAVVDASIARLQQVAVPTEATAPARDMRWVPDDAPDFVKHVTARLLAGDGDRLPVSAFPPDGRWPTGTSRFEKRKIADALPIWNGDTCTQCNQCSLFCPHAALRPKLFAPGDLPEGYPSSPAKGPGIPAGSRYAIQVFPSDCTGCTACVEVCPATDAAGNKPLTMTPIDQVFAEEEKKLAAFEKIPAIAVDPATASAKKISLVPPLFEFSGACSGCTQTPYVRTLTQLFGDHLLIANATGCSSIYGGNLPTTPYCTDACGRGPAWANSLFEDNAEFGLGLHLAAEQRRGNAKALVNRLRNLIGDGLANDLLSADCKTTEGRAAQRRRVDALRETLAKVPSREARRLLDHADYLVPKATWILGGDGWAYDIGYGGLDHVLASGHNVNVLVLDTEVYSNTGGQSSKSTPLGAIAKFAAGGKATAKKDLGRIIMSYGHVYVAQIAFGANPQQAIEVLREAAAFDGPSLVIAYGPCLAHGIDLAHGPDRQKAAVDSGYWPLYRFDPRHRNNGVPPFRLESFEPSVPVAEFMGAENRFKALMRTHPEKAAAFVATVQTDIDNRWKDLSRLAAGDTADDEDDAWG